jgi:glycosyltransferase involved in cell wall biosynthesis
VPHADIESQFDGASLLVNTSPTEGFPNTFLQAWSRGIPTLSFFDPGLGSGGRPAGGVARSIAGMAALVVKWKTEPMTWAEGGRVCRSTYEATFSADAVIEKYEGLFRRLLRPGPPEPMHVGGAVR